MKHHIQYDSSERVKLVAEVTTYTTNIHAYSEIRTRDPTNRETTDLRLTLLSQWDWLRTESGNTSFMHKTQFYLCKIYITSLKRYYSPSNRNLQHNTLTSVTN